MAGVAQPDERELPRVGHALIELGHASANAEASVVEETLVQVGQTVTVAGKLQKSDKEPKLRLVGDADHPIAITIDRARDHDYSADP